LPTINNQQLSSTGKIQNTGTCPSSEVTLSVYLTNGNSIEDIAEGFFLGDYTIPSIQVGNTFDIPSTLIELSLSQAPAGSSYYLAYFLDSKSSIQEINEGNNFAFTGGAINYQGATNVSSFSTAITKEISIQVYPNPFHETIEVSIAKTNNQLLQTNIRDITGKMVKILYSNEATRQIPTEDLTDGVYFVSVLWQSQTLFSKRVIKSK